MIWEDLGHCNILSMDARLIAQRDESPEANSNSPPPQLSYFSPPRVDAIIEWGHLCK